MNKLLTKIGVAFIGIAMAVGVGVAIGNLNEVKESIPVHATNADAYYQFTSKSWASKLNDNGFSSSGTTKNWSGTADGNQLTANQGVQITKTISSSTATCPDSYNGISSIIIRYCTNASSGVGSLVAQVGTTTGSPASFSVTKPSSGGTTLKDATFTFSTPVTGTPKITANCSTNSVFVFGVHVIYTADVSSELTGLRIASGTPNKLYEPGDSFDGTGLVVYASWDDEEDTSKNVLSDVVWNGGSALTAGTNQTIIGYHSDDENEEYPIQVTGVDVVNPDFTHTYSSNSMFEGTSYSTSETKTYTPTSGPEYITLGGYNYTSGTSMSLRNTSGMYVGNNEAYSKCIKRIVIVVNSNSQYNAISMYEGPTALSEATLVAQKASEDKLTLTYDFSDTNQYFKLKSTSNTYINMLSFKVFLGSTPVVAVVSGVSIATPGSVYVGKTLQLSATVSYTNKANDNKVTWAVTSGSGATVNPSTGLVTATAATATTITATSVDNGAGGEPLSDSVTITPIANPIVSVAWDTSAAKKSYSIGESLEISGVTATGTNAAGDDDVAIELTSSNFSGFDSSEATNSQTITVTYLTFSTTYTISVVAAPDVEILPSDFATGSYASADGEHTFDGTLFQSFDMYQNSSLIQCRSSSGYLYNKEVLGQYITSVEISVSVSSVTLYLGTSELTTDTGSQSVTISNSDGAKTITPNSNTYQYLRIKAGASTPKISYIKIWYAPFVPTVTLDESSFEFVQGASGEIEVNATATHFTNNSAVTYTVTSSNQSVLADGDILEDDGYIIISKGDVNPGITTVTVTGTYLTEEAEASFTIACDAAVRNLLSIAITTASSDVEFEAGAKFTISDLVVTGTFDAEPLTANVTEGCTFKLWNGASETALTVGSTTLSSAGNFTVRVSHADSAAAETLTYSITVIAPSTVTVTQSAIGDSIAYADTNVTSFNVALNGTLNSTIDLESHGLYKNGSNLQMNTGKGTYIRNLTAIPGRILRIEMDWASGTDKNSPTIYFGNSYFAEKPDSNGIKVSVGSNHIVNANGNYSYFYFDGNTVTASCQMSELRIVYLPEDDGAARNFADKYLLMNTYDQGGVHGSTNGDGSCTTYYDDAVTAYGKLTSAQKEAFAVLAGATRLADWATANGYTFDPNEGTFTQNSRISLLGNDSDGGFNNNAAIVIISLISISAIGGYFFIRRRKHI